MKIDAHAHVWDPATRDYGWLTPRLGVLYRRYDVDRLRAEGQGAGIDGAIVVQAAASAHETHELMRLAAARDDLLGAVGWIDPGGDVERALTRLCQAPEADALVGIRINAIDHSPEWLAAPQLRARLHHVAAAGLALELLADGERLQAATRLADALPEARIVLDHLGLPPAEGRAAAAWASGIRALAACGETFVKLSGLLPLELPRFAVERLANIALEAFGPERVMFGSDWPVCLTAGSLADVVRLASDLTAGLDATEGAMVWGGAARAAYRLGVGVRS